MGLVVMVMVVLVLVLVLVLVGGRQCAPCYWLCT